MQVCRGNWTCWTISTFSCNLGRAGVGRERAECFRSDVLQGIFLLVTFSTPALGSSASSDTLQRTDSRREARRAMLILGSRWCPCFCLRTLSSFFTLETEVSEGMPCILYTEEERNDYSCWDAFPCQACEEHTDLENAIQSTQLPDSSFNLCSSSTSSLPVLYLSFPPCH